jgi:RNA polymerase sigma-70 factor (ECF subfamily)
MRRGYSLVAPVRSKTAMGIDSTAEPSCCWPVRTHGVAEDVHPGLASVLPRLRRFAIALTGSLTEAEDLVQQACERALARAGQLREATRLDAWMYGIMRHLWQDEMRARRVRRHEQIDAAEDIPGPDGRATAENRLELARVRACLLRMSAEHRTVLTLVCVDGLSYREAAAVLDIPTGTVMSRLSRARRELHEQLAAPKAVQTGTVVAMRPATPGGRPMP